MSPNTSDGKTNSKGGVGPKSITQMRWLKRSHIVFVVKWSCCSSEPSSAETDASSIINEVFLGTVPPTDGGWSIFPFQCGCTAVNSSKRCLLFLNHGCVKLHSVLSTYQTSSDVLNGFLDVHPRPVVQHVADAGRAVDEADVVLASLWHGVKTEGRKRQNGESRINSLKLAARAAALFAALKLASVTEYAGASESEWASAKSCCPRVEVTSEVCCKVKSNNVTTRESFQAFVSLRLTSPAVLELQRSETSQAGLLVHTAQVVSQDEQRAQSSVGHGHMAAVVRMGNARTLRNTHKSKWINKQFRKFILTMLFMKPQTN